MQKKNLYFVLAMVGFSLAWLLPSAVSAFEDVNMGTTITV